MAKPAVLLIPGLGGRASLWDAQVGALSGKFTPIALSHGGHSRVEDFASSIVEILDKKGIEHLTVDVTKDPEALERIKALGYMQAPVVVTVVGVLRMAQIQHRLDHVVNVNNVVTRLVVDMRNNVSERVTSLRTLTLMTDPSDMEPELNRFKEQTAKYDALQGKLAAKFSEEASAEEKSLLNQVKEAEGAAMPAIAKASALYLANNAMDATRVMVKEIRPEIGRAHV